MGFNSAFKGLNRELCETKLVITPNLNNFTSKYFRGDKYICNDILNYMA